MVKATFTHDKESGTIAMSVEGHAGQAKKGHDLICSAVSILAYTVAKYVEAIENVDGLLTKPRIEIDDGYMLVIANPSEKYIAEVLNAFFVAEIGYSLLAQNYPQYVEVKMFGQA